MASEATVVSDNVNFPKPAEENRAEDPRVIPDNVIAEKLAANRKAVGQPPGVSEESGLRPSIRVTSGRSLGLSSSRRNTLPCPRESTCRAAVG